MSADSADGSVTFSREGSAATDSTTLAPSFTRIQVPGYYFTDFIIFSLSYNEKIRVVHGYKTSSQKSIVGKVAKSSRYLEREFYLMKKLYQFDEGPSYIVQPLDCVNLSNGSCVAIYADEGHEYSSDAAAAVGYSGTSTRSSLASASTYTVRPSARVADSSTRHNTEYHASLDNKINSSERDNSGANSKMALEIMATRDTAPTYDLVTFLRFAIKAADCIAFIHRQNFHHGGIQLQSFQWSGQDTDPVKLWNFSIDFKSLSTYLTTEWRKMSQDRTLVHMLENLLVYVSPEKTGRTAYISDHRSDIYSLGIVFFVLLTTRNPFDGGPLDIVNGMLSRKVPLVHELQLEVPKMLSYIIEKMTNKAPDDRYNSARGVQADLQECLKQILQEETNVGGDIVTDFPLAQHDVASIFTLPKIVYGRKSTITKMNDIIEQYATLYKASRIYARHGKQASSYNSSAAFTSQTSSSMDTRESLTEESTSEYSTEESSSQHDNRSTGDSHESFCSGFIGSEVSSAPSSMRVGDLWRTTKNMTVIVSLRGPAGIGKSTLLNAVHATAREKGYMASIKFDATHMMPYSGVFEALSQLLQQILSEPEEYTKRFIEHMKKCLGAHLCNIHLFTEYVPELRSLFDTITLKDNQNITDGYVNMAHTEARKRFQALFIAMFRAFTNWGMVTLFLDDLHHSDVNSLELLGLLMASKIKILAFISYREQEVSPKLAQVLSEGASNIQSIKADAFDINSTIEFLSDTLHRHKNGTGQEALKPLADVLMQKTNGIPFYVSRFIQTMERKKLIFFNWNTSQWDFNFEAIRREAESRLQVKGDGKFDVCFMVGRLRELPASCQELLKWASFLGDTFSWSTLKNVMRNYNEDETTKVEQISHITKDWPSTSLPEQHKPEILSTPSSNSLPTFSDTKLKSSSHSNKKAYHHTASDGLAIALQEEYFVPLGPDEYKWSHDRVAQAAGELTSAEMRGKMHLIIARYMMKDHSANTFLVASHLMKCINNAKAAPDREAFRSVLIEAANRNQLSGTHDVAFANYEAAIELADHDIEWNDTNYTETLSLYTNSAALSWIVGGHHDRTEKLLESIFHNSRDPIDRLNAYRVQSKYFFGCQKPEEGKQTLLHCLEELGFESTPSTVNEDLQRHTDQDIRQQIKGVGKDIILNIKLCSDPLIIGIMTVFDELCTCAFWTGQTTEMYYYGMQILKMTLENGMCAASVAGFNFAALRYALLYKDYEFAECLGSIALALLGKVGSNYIQGRAYFQNAILVLRWRHHYREALDYFETGARLSLSAGDRIYASLHRSYHLLIRLGMTEDIADILVEAESCYEDANIWSASGESNMLIMCFIRLCKALQGRTYTDTPEVFDGDDGFDDAHFVKASCQQSSSPALAMGWYSTFKMLAQVLYGHCDAAVETGYSVIAAIHQHICQRYSRIMIMYFSLALVEKVRQKSLDSEERAKHIAQLRENQQILNEWASGYARVNNAMFGSFIAAEMASSVDDQPDILRACRLYEETINLARDGEWCFHMCIAQEYAGAFYLRNGMGNIACVFLKKAIDLYTRQGSYGIVQHLLVKYADVFNSFSDSREQHHIGVQTDLYPFLATHTCWSNQSPEDFATHGTLDSNSEDEFSTSAPQPTMEQMLSQLDILDFASILKSSHLVSSSETELQNLFSSFLTIIFESVGAECGSIIIKDGSFGIWAYGSQGAEIKIFDPPLSLSSVGEDSNNEELIPTRIIHHTINMEKPVFVRNVEEDPRFATGQWFSRNGKRTVVCIPIKTKDALTGCLIIEGAVGIFNQRHVTLLSLLCQQLGISIANAFLFKSVQRVTRANMRMIENQKQALEEARISKEEAVRATQLREIFLANMSHEIRTPFSGFYGMITLLSETSLDNEQHDLVKTAKKSCEVLLQIIDDLLNFSKLQAGKVKLDMTPVVIEELVADVIEILISIALKKQLAVSYSIARDVPSVAVADANRLRQVLMNLLGNAIKFTHTGTIELLCSVEKPTADGTSSSEDSDSITLMFQVVDTGIGISDEQLKALFVPFSQVDGSTTRKYGGTGLGLSICHQLVTLMSGNIGVTSKPNEGSNFHFTVKAKPAIEQSKARDERTTAMLNELKQTRILVASKHVSTSRMIQQLLPGIQVDSANTIEELRMHECNEYTVVIIGVLLLNDPRFSEWSAHLEKAVEMARTVVAMNYPSTAFIASGPQQDSEGSARSVIKSPVIPVPKDPLGRQALIRITYPARSHRLLQILVDAIHEDGNASSESSSQQADASSSKATPPSKRCKSNEKRESITLEERLMFGSMHILVAEDNPVAQKLLFKQLTRLGFQVDCADNGLDAVAAWTSHPVGYYKLSFFDCHMPKVTKEKYCYLMLISGNIVSYL
ncbi:hypothetical protein BDB00DRAFT_819869 [Zychaea mexicana]|uniref:uncharacterized protein n=1 Tax=Zychaea mexicana TaxID=64656 RepID=UPI0022FE3B0E|nr:uncharacterized protein BDB00DRAFT_819869 [Zychaea mexicana]KAI9494156.1 hypothetical protein BDB00DRAFT_819869 [Zychaea mexicana]